MERGEFFIHAQDTPKNLYVSRRENIRSTALSPCCMTPDDVDYEMSTGKHAEIMCIHGMNQQSLEHFAAHYGGTYRFLHFFKCQKIQDFSPLADLERLEEVRIYWNTAAGRLWDFSRNTSLRRLVIQDCKKMILCPGMLSTSSALEDVQISGSAFESHPMESLAVFGRMPNLRILNLHNIRLQDKDVGFLQEATHLERFDFDAGMFTTEEIAWMVAKYPHLFGKSLCPYNREDAVINTVRVCGYRKPGLDLPRDQNRLDKYTAQFQALVEKFRSEA